ncbi:DUF6774 domain-containing protein [Anaerocolumna xylanovorans]|uniref:DUF6774 domain-containing protein n=1 Tax=Anaerocolumna xylanovorans DSM 12503 TaxID=1121345 RepID=A0A1M7XX40_9FIRM|nr:DUF6774 domain-containing protein [Anaerocolumna xylanovorans]SHO43430.1 hypothetical protein SAMN02745217_00242 [Anaerocolumna xylanovorans DSM 12503]
MKNNRCKMSSCELVTFVTAIACSIANTCSSDEVSLLAAVFAQLGDTLATISVREELLEGDEDTSGSENGSKEEDTTSCDGQSDNSSDNSTGKSGADSSDSSADK